MKYDKRINIRVSKEVYAELSKRAKKQGVKVSEVVRSILVKSLAQEKTDKVVDSFLGIILEDKEIKELIAKKLKEKD